MEQLVLNPFDIATRALIPFRQILNEVVVKKGLKIPPQLNMMVDSVLMGHFIYYSFNIFEDGFNNSQFIDKVAHEIHLKHINKIMRCDFQESGYSLPIVSNIPDYKMDYFKIHIEENYTHKLIVATINNSIDELREVLLAYKKGEDVIPAVFFFNCFIHPALMLDINTQYPNYSAEIEEKAIEVFKYLVVEIPLYLQDFLRKMQS